MDYAELDAHKETLTSLTGEVEGLLEKIDVQVKEEHKENSENGRMEFAYVKYYLAELRNLLNLAVYLLHHNTLRKYVHFPTRLVMEIVLQQEHVYSVKRNKGSTAVKRMFFKDLAISAKSSLEQPGEKGRNVLKNHLSLLDISSKILKLDFKSEDVSSKSARDIKGLCRTSNLVIKGSTGSELHHYYDLLSEASHSNIVSIGASNYGNNFVEALGNLEICLELAIGFCEVVIKESGYSLLKVEMEKMKIIILSKFIFQD